MGHKIVCLSCRKSFSKGRGNQHTPEKCPECGSQYISFTHRFKPPKKDDINAWKVVTFLYNHGFVYQHIYEDMSNSRDLDQNRDYVTYPSSITDAKEFVVKYGAQAKKELLPKNIS